MSSNQYSQPVLCCRDLQVGYQGKAVLEDVNLNFEQGQFISLLGPNGTGKTTLLRTLSRHLSQIAGEVELQGKPLADYSSLELAKFMAVVLTDRVTPPLLTVFEFVALGRYPHTDFLGRLGSEDDQVVSESLHAVHAEYLADRQFNDLSDGERQKVLIARALAQQPKLLLLDEPTSHLDLKHRVELMAILRDLCRKQGLTVIASLHDVDVAAKVSDRVVLIKSGGIQEIGHPEAILTSQAVTDLYDFRAAEFNRYLGGIELRGNGEHGNAFVIGGIGSATLIYRMLAKRGLSITTGVLHSNDLDSYVADSLGATCHCQPAMECIDEQTLSHALDDLEWADFVIDSGFELGLLNQGNLKLLQRARELGKVIFSLRDPENPYAVGGNINLLSNSYFCEDVVSMFQQLDRLLAAENHQQSQLALESA